MDRGGGLDGASCDVSGGSGGSRGGSGNSDWSGGVEGGGGDYRATLTSAAAVNGPEEKGEPALGARKDLARVARIHPAPTGAMAPLPRIEFVPAKTHYPFFVMSVATFMDLDGLLPDHQTMLQRGDLVPHDPVTMKDLTMFISHQCTFTAWSLSRAVAAAAPQGTWGRV